MFMIIFLLFILLIIAHHYMVHHSRIGKFINQLPGPPTAPIIGSIYHFQVPADVLWTTVRKMSDDYYPIFRIWSCFTCCVNVRHPDDIEVVLNSMKFHEKSQLYTLLHPWFSMGLLTSSGAKWQSRRKILTPAFHFHVLQQFVEVFIEESVRMKDSLLKEGGPTVKDLLPLVSEHTLNAICETAMGTSLQGMGEFQERYRKAVYDMASTLVYRLVRPWLYYYPLFALTWQGYRQRQLLKILHGFTRKIIEERKQYHEETGGKYLNDLDEGSSRDSDAVSRKRLAMLDLLIAASKKNLIDDEGIREEVDTFMFEGHDTTGMAICFTIMLLAEHKEIQERARAEVKEALEETDGKLSMSILQRLPYLERCIKEALRLYPSVHFISREIKQDMHLKKYIIPGGTLAHVHIIDVHRDPNFWPNPEVYDPDRFLPEKIYKRHPYSYIPFSAGPRNCIGQRFAMLEMKAMISTLLYNFYFEPVDYLKDLRVTADLVIRPAHPIRTRFVPITQSGTVDAD